VISGEWTVESGEWTVGRGPVFASGFDAVSASLRGGIWGMGDTRWPGGEARARGEPPSRGLRRDELGVRYWGLVIGH